MRLSQLSPRFIPNKGILIFLLLCITYGGCSSSYIVTPTKVGGDYSYNDLTAEFKGKEVDLLLNDGREIRGSQIRVQGDSLFGVTPRDRTSFKVAVREVKRMTKKNHLLGGLEGLGAGALGGLVVIAGSGRIGYDDPGFATTVVTALALPAVGLIVGSVVGYTYIYEFPQDSTNTKTN